MAGNFSKDARAFTKGINTPLVGGVELHQIIKLTRSAPPTNPLFAVNLGSATVGVTSSKRPVLGVYLAYYENYGVTGVNKFKRFLGNLDANAELIVACNSSIFDLLHDYPAHVIRGDNVLREFSGWESGLDYARSIGIDLDKYLLIFANDTFCNHNNFGPISRFAFSRAFKQLMKSPKVSGLAGEVWTFGARVRQLQT